MDLISNETKGEMSVWTLTGRGLPIKRSKDGWDPFLTIEERDEREGVRPNYDRPLHFHKLYQIPKITKENKDEKDGERIVFHEGNVTAKRKESCNR